MKFKLDENFGIRAQNIFQAAGHDVKTVWEEELSGTSDENLFQICQDEARCLVTLDLDFTNILRFPPQDTEGIVVFRLPRNPKLSNFEYLANQFIKYLKGKSVKNSLWIIETGRIRIHEHNALEGDRGT